MDEPTRDTTGDTSNDDAPARRSMLVGALIGLACAFATIGVVYAIVAIPIYTLAQADPESGLDRPFMRDALVTWGIPLGAIVGLAIGTVVAIWYHRGGRLPTDRSPFERL